MKFTFRPHHFLCTLGFQGMGYSTNFTLSYTYIVDTLNKNEDTLIEVTEGADSVCIACPHQRAEGCKTGEKALSLDERHGAVLNIKPGDSLTWKEAKERIKNNMTLEAFHEACEGCEWKVLGVCEEMLRNLHDA